MRAALGKAPADEPMVVECEQVGIELTNRNRTDVLEYFPRISYFEFPGSCKEITKIAQNCQDFDLLPPIVWLKDIKTFVFLFMVLSFLPLKGRNPDTNNQANFYRSSSGAVTTLQLYVNYAFVLVANIGITELCIAIFHTFAFRGSIRIAKKCPE